MPECLREQFLPNQSWGHSNTTYFRVMAGQLKQHRVFASQICCNAWRFRDVALDFAAGKRCDSIFVQLHVA